MVGKEVARASPMSFIAARGLAAPHALTRTYSTMCSSSGKRTDGQTADGRCPPFVCPLLRCTAIRQRPIKAVSPETFPSNHPAPAQITDDAGEPSRNPEVNKQGGPPSPRIGSRKEGNES